MPALRAAADLLAARGLFGFAWLDGNLIVRQTFGRLADPIRVGLPVTAGLLALIGIEPEILALTAAADAPIVLPNVGIDPSDETASRMNIAKYLPPVWKNTTAYRGCWKACCFWLKQTASRP